MALRIKLDTSSKEVKKVLVQYIDESFNFVGLHIFNIASEDVLKYIF